MTIPNRRLINGLGFLTCAGMMAFALYAEYVLFLMPCPLCSFQRLAVILLGIVFFAAMIHDPRGFGRRVYAGLVAIVALGGIGVAGWHLYIQSLPPDKVPACGPGLGYMLESLPLAEALERVFTGSGECADVSWSLLGLSMPAWVLIGVLGLGAMGVFNNLRRSGRPAEPGETPSGQKPL